jgi:acyl carrier protein phosphodiesterase
MNFLAHLYLSRHSESLMIGNFIGDTIKGNQWQLHPEEIAKGILMHRAIDHFIDHHPIARATSARFKPDFGKYSGVLTDMCYDYFLASRWIRFHEGPLEDFAAGIYGLIQRNDQHLSERARFIFAHMQKHNWLCLYESLEGMERILEMMSHRIGHRVNLAAAIPVIREQELEIEKEFLPFMEEARMRFESNGEIEGRD